MSYRSVRLILTAALVLAVGCAAHRAFSPPPAAVASPRPTSRPVPPPALSPAEKTLFDHANTYRRQHGRSPVALEGRLCAAARAFADHMARTDRYGHNADGREPADRAEMQGYRWRVIRENIACAYDSRGFMPAQLARTFHEGWRDSSGHRRNMLASDVTQMGIAVARSSKTGRYYAVQLLARPR